MKKKILLLSLLFLLPSLSVFATAGLDINQIPTKISKWGICGSAYYDFSHPGVLHPDHPFYYSVVYDNSFPSGYPLSTSTGDITYTVNPISGWTDIPNTPNTHPEERVWCVNRDTLLSHGITHLYDVRDNEAGDCEYHRTHGNDWTMQDCIDHGTTPIGYYWEFVIPTGIGAAVINSLTAWEFPNPNPNIIVVTEDSNPSADGLGASNLASWGIAQVLLVLGSSFGYLSIILLIMIALLIIGIIVYFLYRAFRFNHH